MAAARRAGQLRDLLARAAAALKGLGAGYAAVVEADDLQPRDKYRALLTDLFLIDEILKSAILPIRGC